MKSKILALLLVLSFNCASAQNHEGHERCGTDALHAVKMQDAEYAASFYQKKMAVREYIYDRMEGSRADCAETIFIPVAVHFQGVNGLQMACAVDKAIDQVRILNEDFAGVNLDIARWEELNPTVWPTIQNKESCVQFCLATLNHPVNAGIQEGNYAVTINATDGSFSNVWSGYMNMFVRELGGGTLGFSPLGGSGNGDGITVGVSYFSSISCSGVNVETPYHLGRTATHEAGHYLLLEHPFGSCDNDPDGIADTPRTDVSTGGCPYVPDNPAANEVITCTAPVLWPSYMDYSDDEYLFMFSAGQVNVMEGYVNTGLQNLVNKASTTCQDALCVGFRAQIAAMDESCSGVDGAIDVNLTGGKAPFLFSINGGVNFQDNGSFGNLQEGIYEVVVRDSNLCEIPRQVTVAREVPPLRVIGQGDAFCGDNTGTVQLAVDHPDIFEFSISGQPGWQDASTFTALRPGDYTVSIQNAGGCTNSIPVTIGDETDLRFVVQKFRPVNCPLFDNGVIWMDVANGVPPMHFTLNSEWPQSSGRYENLAQGSYTLEVQDARGCKLAADYEIGVSFLEIDRECPCDVFVPNAFTPDADGLNDLLDVVPSCPISEYKLEIFDRWGGLIFESDDRLTRWNGGQGTGYYARNDIYFYRISFRWGLERNESLEVQVKTGYVQLMR